MNMMTPVGRADADPDPLRDRLRRLPRWQRRSAVALPVVVAALVGARLVGGADPAPAAPVPPAVTVGLPVQADVVEWDEQVGRFEASRSVEVRPRVSGALRSIHFRDGDTVRQGQLLFTIDPRPFEAALAEARAREADALAKLALARSDLARAERLIDDEAVSREEVDSLRAAARSAEAMVAAARAQVQARALDLDFTRVRAPIAGRISDRRVDVGNLVGGQAEAATLLTTIHAVDPIYFTFEASEALHLKYRRQAGGPTTAEVRLQDEADYRWKGRIDFTDNEVDPRAGTVRGRVVVDNPSGFLTPGLFGNMRLASATPRPALLVPDAAVRTDQARKVVLVVGDDGTVAAKPVDPGARVGDFRTIRAGLAPTDRVVVAGTQFAQPGSKVEARPTRLVLARPDAPTHAYTAPAPAQATLAD